MVILSFKAVSEKIVVAARPNDPWILQNHSTLYTLMKDLEVKYCNNKEQV